MVMKNFENFVEPKWSQMKDLVKQGNCVPMYVEIPADLLTPVSAFLKLALNDDYSFLFESASGEKSGRYSFVGRCSEKNILIQNNNDPLIAVENYMKDVEYVSIPNLPSFTGGAVGFIGFDCIHHFEPHTARPLIDELEIPDSVMMFCDSVVIFDSFFGVVKVVSHLRYNKNDSIESIESQYNEQLELLKVTLDILNQLDTPMPDQKEIHIGYEMKSNVGRDGYEGFVKQLKTNIKKGDIIQAVPSQRVARKTDLHPFNVYRKLRTINPSPYMFYVNMKGFQLIGASPEALVKVYNNEVETHPIAGTRKRGKTVEEDEALAKELLADEKERAEHIMLVDLGRNDVNRVCEPLSVKVCKLMEIERYSHVMHIVSNVTGTLREDCTPFDAFRAIFPAGTVSGAPKIRAIELIQDLEKIKRHVYAGSVGWFSFNGDLDCCIALRTIMMKDSIAYLQAGGGIVHDSDPSDEYHETINKMNSNATTLEKAEAYFKNLQ